MTPIALRSRYGIMRVSTLRLQVIRYVVSYGLESTHQHATLWEPVGPPRVATSAYRELDRLMKEERTGI